MTAAVINRFQTAPASAHFKQKRKTFRIPALWGDPQLTSNVDQVQTGENRDNTVCVSCLSVYFVSTTVLKKTKEKKKKHSGEELNDIFNGSRWPALGKVLFLLQYLLKIKSIYL